ncbi:MAG: CreA family protein [Pseudomonadota bacterium]
MIRSVVVGFVALVIGGGAVIAQSDPEPELIFRKSTVFNLLTPDHKLATYAIDDPIIKGVACHFTVPEKGGFEGLIGIAEELSIVSLACRQVGPVTFTGPFEQGEEMFRMRRSVMFKRMRIVRGCDATRNVLVYLVYTDKLIEGSPENSTSTVPIMPWADQPAPRCGDYLED